MINDVKDGNSSPLINLNADQQKFVDSTNQLFSNIQDPNLSYKNKEWTDYIYDFFHPSKIKDMISNDYYKKLEIALQNTAIRRRVSDALQSGVNPIFALNAGGAGDSLSTSRSTDKSDDIFSSLIKMILGVTFLMKMF